MNDEKVTKAKLYTYTEMKDAVAQVIADMAADSATDGDYNSPAKVAIVEALIGSKILAELEIRHRKGEL